MAQSKGGQTATKLRNQGNGRAEHPMKGKRRGKTESYKDVFMAYMINGVEGVEALAGNVSSDTLWHAFQALEASGRDRTPLKNYIEEQFPNSAPGAGGGGRGRTSPQVGETRPYKAQVLAKKDADGNVIGEQEPFLRLPLGSLGVERGGSVQASFQDGQIVITLQA